MDSADWAPKAPHLPGRPDRRRISLFELMLFIAGMGLGLWIIVPTVREAAANRELSGSVLAWTFVLGGLSLVGPPLLIWERLRSRRKRPFGAGRVLWFSQGMASWLLWPPVIYRRVHAGNLDRSTSAMCYAYGTPLMALYVTSALVWGGWLRKRRRRALMRSWRERFGLGLALVWACLGLYVLSIFYRDDFRQ